MKRQAQRNALNRIGSWARDERIKRRTPEEEIGSPKAMSGGGSSGGGSGSRRGEAARSGLGMGGSSAYTGPRRQPGTPRGSNAPGPHKARDSGYSVSPAKSRYGGLASGASDVIGGVTGSGYGGGRRRAAPPLGERGARDLFRRDPGSREGGISSLLGGGWAGAGRTPAPPSPLDNAITAAGQSVGQSDEMNEEEVRRAQRRRRDAAAARAGTNVLGGFVGSGWDDDD